VIIQQLKKHKAMLAGLTLLIAFAVLLYWFMNPGKTPDQEVNPDRLVEFEGSELEESKDGNLVWRLTADKIMIDPDTQIMYFINPKALLVSSDGTEMTVTSEKGIVDKTKQTIQIQPPVKAVTDKGDTLQTDGSVYYNMDTHVIKGGKVVMNRHDNTTLRADAFETDSGLNKVSLTGHAQVTKGE
jgi:lipopolysaccharide export system protein LptC